MIDFNYYKDAFKGKVGEDEFSSLLPYVTKFLQSYCESFIATWNLKDNFDNYELNLKDAVCYQLEFIFQNGGINIFNGQSDLDISSVNASGYSYTINNEVKKFKGIPISMLADEIILKELRLKGFMRKLLQ